jgi:ubiquinone/menaquinone biosynthesis C-methylase UbiE
MRRTLLFAASLLLALTLAAGEYEVEAAKLADLMHWRSGEVIAEIGAGEGQMSFFAASRVGNTGHVYTTELDDQKLAHLRQQVKKRKLENVTVVKADPIGTNLPDACCEAIFMRRVYHHFKDPAQTDLAILRALRPGGLLAVIDFTPRSGLPPIEGAPQGHAGHGIAKNSLLQELKSAGFETVTEPKNWPDDDYCVIVRKPTAPN